MRKQKELLEAGVVKVVKTTVAYYHKRGHCKSSAVINLNVL